MTRQASALSIEPATPADCEALSALAFRSKASWGYSDAFMAACREELRVTPLRLRADGYRCFVARLDGRLAGFCAVEARAGEPPELEALFVEPGLMRGGVGSALLARAAEAAAGFGAAELQIQSDPYALPFYLAAGAVQTGTRPSDSIPGRELPLLTLAL